MNTIEIEQLPTKQELFVRMLRRAILDGTYKPGHRLRQAEIATSVGLSRTPVREAFRQLEAEGLISTDSNRRVVVAGLSWKELEELYFVRLLVEPVASRLGAERMDEDTLEQMRRILAQMEALKGPEKRPTLIRLDEEFHGLQYRASGQRRLCDLVAGLRASSERYIRAFYTMWPHDEDENVAAERSLLEACEQRDGQRAEEITSWLLKRTVNTFQSLMDN
ncbi:MAG: GntR family transcriptional regulator [Verrucomicrobia bacterium]|nr:GntR family transcriptional regulator [Verrucomicrobiota bacterium]